VLFTAFAVLFRLFARPRWKGWLLYAASILTVYWLQPATPVRYLDFWFPTLTLALAVCGWMLTRQPGETGARIPEKSGQAADAPKRATPLAAQGGADQSLRGNLPAAAALAGLVLLLGLTRFLDSSNPILPSRPPAFEQTVIAVLIAAALALGLGWLAHRVAPGQKSRAGLLWGSIAVLVILLVVLKTPALALSASVGLRDLMNQSTALAAAGDLRWLGFSYVAFRLIHTLRDRQNGRLPAVSLQEYMVYVIFFPAFTAGPIDRLERFIKDLRAAPVSAPAGTPVPAMAIGLVASQAWSDWAAAGERLTLGLFKKFVIADGLALAALNATNAAQVNSAGWAWGLAAAYSLQIYFDFSGYTDIAIGLGRLLGFNLPENFNAPYFKANLTLFWNSWHMTLTNWFRAYYFNPVTRWLRTLKLRQTRRSAHTGPQEDESGVGLPPQVIMFATQLSTFVLIGLWHGVGWNFVLWGTWHGVGLFAQNRWTEAMRPRYAALESRPRLRQAATLLSTALTFVYVTLGWVFFALPDPGLSLRVLGKMFGVG
jgi:alginate O-acetyltransferase complex protein AlgI